MHRCFALMLTLVAWSASAQTFDAQNFVLRNVYLSAEGAPETLLNLLVSNGKLKLISPDKISVPEGSTVLDAKGGFVIGKLQLGDAPNFIILDGDPRDDFDILLDTQTHAVFAIREGSLRKNDLSPPVIDIDPPEDKQSKRQWLAYTPPAIVIPTNYGDPSKWNQWETENTAGIFTAAIVLDRQYWPSQDADSIAQVGDLEEFEGGEIRGLRFGVVGTLDYFERPWVYTQGRSK